MHLKLVAGDALAPRDIGFGNLFPIHLGQPGGDVLPFPRWAANQSGASQPD